jgi:glutamyl-tRNA reductase
VNRGAITGISVSHALASVEEVDSAAPSDASDAARSLRSRPGVEEAVVLATCNRAEAYVVTTTPNEGRDALADFAPDVREGAVVHMDHEESIRHLMRVAAGLESLVLGEDQILGQLKRTLDTAREDGTLGPVLEEVFLKAVHVGERARTETGINEGTVSMGSAAVDLAAHETALDGASALVLGAGEMGTLAARALDETGVSRLVVANRSLGNAEHVVADLQTDGVAVGLGEAVAAAQDADVVVAATGAPSPVLTKDDLDGAGETVCVDIARPRDIDPEAGDLPGVVVHDIDDLEAVTAEAHAQRRTEATEVEALIDEEFDRLLRSFKRARADEAISAMYEGAERMKARELDRALTKLDAQGDLNEAQRETVQAMADALVSQLLAPPTQSLREAAGEDDWTTIQTAMELFDPSLDLADFAGGPPTGVVDELSDD